MSLITTVIESYQRSFQLYRDLVDAIDEATLSAKLPRLPSNTLGSQLWCVVGARESYAKAIMVGHWSGFACALDQPENKQAVGQALSRSEQAVLNALKDIDTFNDAQRRFAIDLLEHEAAHQGQLIRYLYGLRLAIPDSWKTRYALD